MRGINNDFLRLVLRALARLHLGDPSVAPDVAAVFAALAASFAEPAGGSGGGGETWVDELKILDDVK